MEVEVPRKSYGTELISVDNEKGTENVARTEGGGFLKAHIFTLTVPQASVLVLSLVIYIIPLSFCVCILATYLFLSDIRDNLSG